MQENVTRQTSDLLQKGFVILDLETTGLGRDPSVEIVEIAILDHRGAILMNTLVKPQRPIPYAASRVNHIYDEDVADAPPFQHVLLEMLRHLTGQTVVAYNIDFEKQILRTVLRRAEQPPIKCEWFCAMKAYSAYRGRLDYFKLISACKTERIQIANAHRALGDCRLTLALMQTMAGAQRT